MAFDSYSFVLFFLPAVLLIYWMFLSKHQIKAAKITTILVSCLFIAWNDIWYLVFVLIDIMINYGLAHLYLCKRGHILFLDEKGHATNIARISLSINICLNILTLAVFKYAGFILSPFSIKGVDFTNIFVPLGISFITFQQVSFHVDLSKGEIEDLSFIDYLLYITFFPKFIEGPITKYNVLMDTWNENDFHLDTSTFSLGLWMFITGLARKVLVSNVLAAPVSWIWDNVGQATSLELFIGSICYTLQIYFDFSGYSLMAIGIAHMMGLSLTANFDSPYRALSIDDFWKRWHISLTSFLREYLYFPLGGNRKGVIRTYCNILLIFLVSGLWHGAAWTFVLWGLMHGLASCFDRLTRPVRHYIPRCLQWLFTFLYVNFAWILFRAPSVSDAVQYFQRMFTWSNAPKLSTEFSTTLITSDITFLASKLTWLQAIVSDVPQCILIIFLLVFMFLALSVKDNYRAFHPTVGKAIFCILLLTASVLSMAKVVTFIYARF